MIIKRISQIKDFGSFVDFAPEIDLPSFERFNIFYGWNRSGKTTLSRLLRCFEVNEHFVDFPGSEFELLLGNGKKINNQNLQANINLRVFNKDFIESNISWEGSLNTRPIFYIGEENIGLNKQIEDLQEEYAKKQTILQKSEAELSELKDKQEKSLSLKAQEIKNTLTTTLLDKYRNYDKRDLEPLFIQPKNISGLSKGVFVSLKQNIAQESLNKLSAIEIEIDLRLLVSQAKILLEKSIVAQAIKKLKEDSELNSWTRQGLFLHKTGNHKVCLFCNQDLPEDHLGKLEKHFNDKYDTQIKEIKELIKRIVSSKITLNLYDSIRLYKEFQSPYEEASKDLKLDVNSINSLMDTIIGKLLEKEKNPFNKVDLPIDIKNTERLQGKLSVSYQSINTIISQHNKRTEKFNISIKEDKEKLENLLASQLMDDFQALKTSVQEKDLEVQSLLKDLTGISSRVEKFQGELLSHYIPVKFINDNIEKFLGYNEIKIVVNDMDKSYQIQRNGKTATNLSESEKTAIALVYFLVKLKENSFPLDKGIVVLDDPVSSMDSNLIFEAFGFIKNYVKEAQQVFIFTHNFDFFRQVKNWFSKIRKSDIGFFMLECAYINNRRRSSIKPLDNLLLNYHSEYHYLFSLIFRFVEGKETSLEKAYNFPNIARKFLESFLAFKIPTTDTLYYKVSKLNQVSSELRTKVLRFVETHSHSTYEDGLLNMDMTILGETGSVLKDLLDLLEKVDKEHYILLKESITN